MRTDREPRETLDQFGNPLPNLGYFVVKPTWKDQVGLVGESSIPALMLHRRTLGWMRWAAETLWPTGEALRN